MNHNFHVPHFSSAQEKKTRCKREKRFWKKHTHTTKYNETYTYCAYKAPCAHHHTLAVYNFKPYWPIDWATFICDFDSTHAHEEWSKEMKNECSAWLDVSNLPVESMCLRLLLGLCICLFALLCLVLFTNLKL